MSPCCRPAVSSHDYLQLCHSFIYPCHMMSPLFVGCVFMSTRSRSKFGRARSKTFENSRERSKPAEDYVLVCQCVCIPICVVHSPYNHIATFHTPTYTPLYLSCVAHTPQHQHTLIQCTLTQHRYLFYLGAQHYQLGLKLPVRCIPNW